MCALKASVLLEGRRTMLRGPKASILIAVVKVVTVMVVERVVLRVLMSRA